MAYARLAKSTLERFDKKKLKDMYENNSKFFHAENLLWTQVQNFWFKSA